MFTTATVVLKNTVVIEEKIFLTNVALWRYPILQRFPPDDKSAKGALPSVNASLAALRMRG